MSGLRRVLFVCATFPPHVGGALARNVQFARHLPERGWATTVLTVRGGAGPYQDASPLSDLPCEVRVVRAWSPRYPGAPPSGAVAPGQRAPGGIRPLLRRVVRAAMLRWVLIPDPQMPWVPFAVRAARRLLAEQRYDAILSAGPPYSAHVVASVLRGSRGIRWVADCTDPWSDNPYWPYGRIRAGIDRWLERRVLRLADAIVTPTASLTERFRTLLGPRATFATVPNGYDEREFGHLRPLRRDGLHLVHVGSFYGGRSPATFLAAFERVREASASLRDRLRITFAGYADPAAQASISSAQRRLGEDVLRYEPFVERQAAIGLMVGADALVLVTDTTAAGRELIPSKTYEYLRADRPILALVPHGELRTLLERAGGAVFAPPDDTAEVARALRSLLEEPGAVPRRDPAVVEVFEARRLTGLLAEILS